MDDVEEKVVSLHATGMAPSRIDEELGLASGTAHDIMVYRWRMQREASLAWRI